MISQGVAPIKFCPKNYLRSSLDEGSQGVGFLYKIRFLIL